MTSRPVMYYREVIDWLKAEYGLRESYVRGLIGEKVIKGSKLGRGNTLYSRTQIQKDVLTPLNLIEEGPDSSEKSERKLAQ